VFSLLTPTRVALTKVQEDEEVPAYTARQASVWRHGVRYQAVSTRIASNGPAHPY
jgi:hypothetical protein